MIRIAKYAVRRLPHSWQMSLRHQYLRRQMRGYRLSRRVPELDWLKTVLSAGDCVIDIGANMGLYTVHFADLVGPTGRVIALEPVPATFRLLTDVVSDYRFANVTLLNTAASNTTMLSGMTLPGGSGYAGFYTAELSAEANELTVLCLAIDGLAVPNPVKLVKIDTEGHELNVLRGMENLLRRDHPLILLESNADAAAFLSGLGYEGRQFPGSANGLYTHKPNG